MKTAFVNKHGVTVANLKAGDWITLEFKDVPNERMLLVDIEERRPEYKGDRTLKCLTYYPNESGDCWSEFRHADSSQIVSIDGKLVMPK